ncbi:MAG: hypothetical protein HY226_04240 [Candidatus Vogelbacteria bacterium]|nr:hypothetical protein [Candidatus Vogelbacteria bacterium]
MKNGTSQEMLKPKEDQQLTVLKEKFDALNDIDAAHSIITWEIFELGNAEDKKHLEERLMKIKDESIRDDALFQMSKRYYEIAKDLSKAEAIALKIKDANEKNRCLIHLANDVLDTEENVGKADHVIKNYDIGSNAGYYHMTGDNFIGKKSNASGYSDTGFLDWLSTNLDLDKSGYLKYYLEKKHNLLEKKVKTK